MGRGLKSLFRSQGDWYSVGPRYGARNGVVVGAIFVLVCGLVMWKVFLVPDTQPTPNRYGGRMPASTSVGGSKNSQGQLDAVAQYEEQIALGKGLVQDMVKGRISGSDLDIFGSLPEFGDCRKCLDECEQKALSKDRTALDLGEDDCRRDCLAHCSALTRSLMH